MVEARVRHLSQFDELTGLANRSLFKERPEKLQAIQRARDHGFKFSEPGKPSKPVNDK